MWLCVPPSCPSSHLSLSFHVPFYMLSHGGRLRLGSYYGQGQGGQHAGSEEVVRSGYVPTRSAVRSGTFQEAAYVLTCKLLNWLIVSTRSDKFCATLPCNLKSIVQITAIFQCVRYVLTRSTKHSVLSVYNFVTFRYVPIKFRYVLPCKTWNLYVFGYVLIRSVQQYR